LQQRERIRARTRGFDRQLGKACAQRIGVTQPYFETRACEPLCGERRRRAGHRRGIAERAQTPGDLAPQVLEAAENHERARDFEEYFIRRRDADRGRELDRPRRDALERRCFGSRIAWNGMKVRGERRGRSHRHAALYAPAARGFIAGDDFGVAAGDCEQDRWSVRRLGAHGARVHFKRQ
jgi:hypothetical protein